MANAYQIAQLKHIMMELVVNLAVVTAKIVLNLQITVLLVQMVNI